MSQVGAVAFAHRSRSGRPASSLGSRVVLTGDMSNGKEELKALAEKAGLRVTGSVSGKTSLVVAADPWSQSGKAHAARQLGVRIVTEQVFRYFVEQILADNQPSAVPSPGLVI